MKMFIPILSLFLAIQLSAQNTVTYGEKTVKANPDILRASLGTYGESFSFEIYEHDLGPNGAWGKEIKRLQAMGQEPNPEDAPKGLFLSLEVKFKNGLKFPIEPTDSIVLSLSTLKQSLAERDFQNQQIAAIDKDKMSSDTNALNQEKESVEAQMQKIAKLVQEGKLSPDDAAKKLEALTTAITAQTDVAIAPLDNLNDYNEGSTYSFNFTDTNENIETEIYSGYLYIVEFNKERLVAYIKGKQIVSCIDVKRQNDKTSGCHKPSALIPGVKVFEESDVYISINTSFQEFNDYRQ